MSLSSLKSAKKRIKISEIVPKYDKVPRQIAFQILTDAEVQDAMNFVLAAGGDERYQQFLIIMREDEIWQFWFQRDLAIVEKYRSWGEVTEAPAWKVYYLWWRLFISSVQYDIISGFNESADVMERSVFHADARLEYVRLNTFEVIVPGQEPVTLDFREHAWRFGAAFLPETFNKRRLYNTETISRLYQKLGKYAENTFFDAKVSDIARSVYRQIFAAFLVTFSGHVYGANPRVTDGLAKDYRSYLDKSPRQFLEGKLLVTSCVTCGQKFYY